MDKAVIDAIREKEQLPNSMTDSEIAKEYKGTYTAAWSAVMWPDSGQNFG